MTTHDDPAHAADRARVSKRLEELGFAHRTVLHPPVMTVDEGRAFKADMPGGHSKNLFVKDKKSAHYLVVAHCDTKVDLVGVGKALGARGRLSFARADAMIEILGVEPGSVTPFALMNAPSPALAAVAFDTRLLAFETVWFHPLRNTASTAVAPEAILAMAQNAGYAPVKIDAAAPLG
ncbi:MAG: prolyl-tRNA synthetase associated domain-containing protein [Pseudomonadota bacterium]